MKITDIENRLLSGARLMRKLPRQPHHRRTYNLDCGSAVRPEQFEKLRDQLAPCDPP
jgi:predicted nucleotidyltransferase